MITLTAKIYISDTEVIEVDRRNMLGVDCSIFDRSDLKLPSFGIISNKGNIEFNDYDGRVLRYAESLQLVAGQKCEIWLNNTLVEGASERIALLETDQWDYDNDSMTVSVSIKDDLEEWQEINDTGISYDPSSISGKPFSWLYEYLWGATMAVGNYDLLQIDQLDAETQNVLKNNYMKYPLLESGSLWKQWTKLCQSCQLHIYKDRNGKIVCRYNGGN